MLRTQTIKMPHQAALRGRLALRHFAFACLATSAWHGTAHATLNNTATASGTYNAAPVISDPATESVTVTPSAPGLTVVKTADDTTSVTVGQIITYTYAITNSGNATVSNVALSDSSNGSGPAPVPGSETLTSDQGTIGDSTDATSNNGTWSTLAPGDTVTFTATYTVTQNDVDTKQ